MIHDAALWPKLAILKAIFAPSTMTRRPELIQSFGLKCRTPSRIAKGILLLPTLGSGSFMLACALGFAALPDAMRLAPSGADKFEWGAAQPHLAWLGDASALMLVCACCKVAAGVSFLTGILEPLASLCVVIYFALIAHAHYAMQDDWKAPVFLAVLALFKAAMDAIMRLAAEMAKQRSD